MKRYNEIETWERCEGGETAYNFEGELLIEIEALQDRYDRAKWGEKYTPGRSWVAFAESGEVIRGQSPNIAQARKAAVAALKENSQ